MAIIRITKQFSFEMAHALSNYDGLCKNIHGHSYKMDVTIKGMPKHDDTSPKNGMLLDFGDLKKIVNDLIIKQLDHALVLSSTTDEELITLLKRHYDKIVVVPFQPTTENLLNYFSQLLVNALPAPVRLHSLRLRETDSSYAEWCAEDNE